MLIFFEKIGFKVKSWVGVLTAFSKLSFEAIYWVLASPFLKKKIDYRIVYEQMVFMGVQSIVIVFYVIFFTGIVLAMQSAVQLQKMGGLVYVSSLVTISICRELGPVLTALVIAGRVGAAVTAEIGSMKVNEQIEALETMAVNPVKYLVAPKLLALMVMLPCLTVVGDVAGILGGYVLGVGHLKINSGLYILTASKMTTLVDVYSGLSKSFVFAFLIVIVGAFQGLKTRGGAVGVGKSTTVSVVTSFILIIFSDAIITAFYFLLDMQ